MKSLKELVTSTASKTISTSKKVDAQNIKFLKEKDLFLSRERKDLSKKVSILQKK